MKRKRNVYWTLILCIIIAAVVFPFSVNKMQDTLLKSGQSMGAESASKYGSREEMYTEQYEYIPVSYTHLDVYKRQMKE